MKSAVWRLVALVVSRPLIADWLIQRAQRTPYAPIHSRKGFELYMDRWWLFNPYGKTPDGQTVPPRFAWLPSIRVHHICLPDDDEHEHDHPWDARTIILHGTYFEERRSQGRAHRFMTPGRTAPIMAGAFHRIVWVRPGGVYTLFFTWGHVEDWGFNVDGRKVNWREYLDAEGA